MTSIPDANAFWTFSVSVWSSPTLQRLLLAHQEKSALDINLCLLALWCAKQKKSLHTLTNQLIALHEEWSKKLIQPMRALRQHADSKKLPDLKEQLLASELLAEKKYQDALYLLVEELPYVDKESASLFDRNLQLCDADVFSPEEKQILMESIR